MTMIAPPPPTKAPRLTVAPPPPKKAPRLKVAPPPPKRLTSAPPPPPKKAKPTGGTPVVTAHDYVTVITSDQPIGKEYSTNAGDVGHDINNPVVRKRASFNNGSGTAQTFSVPNVTVLGDIIRSVQNNELQALVLSYIPETVPTHGASFGKPFQIRSMKEFMEITGQKSAKKPRKVGPITYACRNGDMMERSSWFMFDLDSNLDTPVALQERIDNEPYIDLLGELYPPLKEQDYVSVGSASSRVSVKGVPVSKENRHIYMRAQHPNDLPRFAGALLITSYKTEFGYATQVRDSLSGEVIPDQQGAIASIFDRAVFSVARVSYEGKPRLRADDPHVLNGDLTVGCSNVDVVTRTSSLFDSSGLQSPSRDEQRATRMNFGQTSRGFQIINDTDLLPVTMINVKCLATNDESWISMREFAAGDTVRYRAQNPFKPSSTSWSAFLSKENAEGEPCPPFLYSVEFGTYIYNDLTHYFMTPEACAEVTTKMVEPPKPAERLRVAPAPPAARLTIAPAPPVKKVAPAPPQANEATNHVPDIQPVPTLPINQPPITSAPPPPVADPLPQAVAVVPAPLPVNNGWFERDVDTQTVTNSTQVLTTNGSVTLDNGNSPEMITKALIDGNLSAIKFDAFEVSEIQVNLNARSIPGDSETDIAEYIVKALFGIDDEYIAINARYINSVLYSWNGRFWEEIDEQVFKSYIQRSLMKSGTKSITNNKSNSITKLCLNMCTPIMEMEPLPKHLLAVSNGIFDWQLGTFSGFKREYFYTSVKEFPFDPVEYGKGVFAKVMIDACTGDANFQRRLLHMNAYAASGGYNQRQCIVMYNGVTRSGKSLLGTMASMITPAVLSSRLNKLADNKVMNNLEKKSLFYDDEAATPNPMERTAVASAMKNITSDAKMDLTRLYSDDMKTATVNMKMVLCCNAVPLLPDPGGAIAKRIEGIRFSRSFGDAAKQDSALNDALNDPREMSAILNLTIAGYVDLLKSNGYESFEHYHNSHTKRLAFHTCASSEKLHESIRLTSTPLIEFMKDSVSVAKNARTTMASLINSARAWAERERVDFLGKQSSSYLRRQLEEILPGIGATLIDDKAGTIIGINDSPF